MSVPGEIDFTTLLLSIKSFRWSSIRVGGTSTVLPFTDFHGVKSRIIIGVLDQFCDSRIFFSFPLTTTLAYIGLGDLEKTRNQSSDILQHSQNRPTGDRWLKF